jgi:DNA-binding NarL/FixJ family response regulator
MNAPPQVLIVEDLPASADWLAAAVASALDQAQVLRAGTVAAALAAARRQAFALALVDLDLPDGSGLQIVEQLAQAQPRPVIIVTTVFADDQHVFPALRAGAQGYLLKDGTVEQLAGALRAAMAGDAVLATRVAKRVVGFFHEPAPAPGTPLSPREQELLQLLAKGMTIAQAAAALRIGAGTAAGYTKSLYRKLDVTSRAEATLEALRRGLVKL